MKHEFRVIDGCPCPKLIAPYIYICLKDSRTTSDSIYRGNDSAARRILNAHHKHTQEQLFQISLHGTPAEREAVGLSPGGGGVNEPGFSTHELKSDAVAYRSVPAGDNLAWWQEGWDMEEPSMCEAVIKAARSHGWIVFQPYHSGSELHHLNFRFEPSPHTRRMAIRIKFLRARLPRH